MIAISNLAMLLLLAAAPDGQAALDQPPAWTRRTLAALPVTIRPTTIPHFQSRAEVARFLSPILTDNLRGISHRMFVGSWDPFYARSPDFQRARTPEDLGVMSSVNAGRLQDLICEFAAELTAAGWDVTQDLRNVDALMARGERIERFFRIRPVYLVLHPLGPGALPRRTLDEPPSP
jgi:hypothetical protein